MPKVSILIINYNYAQYLDERIQSILNQTYKDFELLIIENGSTDNSLDVINQYTEDPRITVIAHSENASPLKRWNDAVELTQGEYLMFASSDDSCEPRLLEELVAKLDNYPAVGLAYSHAWAIDEKGNRSNLQKDLVHSLNPALWDSDFVYPGPKICQYLLFGNIIPFIALVRRSVFLEAGKFDTQLSYEADWLLWAKVLTISDIAYIAERLTLGRIHKNSLGKVINRAASLEGRLAVIRYLLSKVEPPDRFWEEVYQPLVGYWTRLLFSEKIPIKTNLRIYSLLRQIDPILNYRLLKKLVEVLTKKLSPMKQTFS